MLSSTSIKLTPTTQHANELYDAVIEENLSEGELCKFINTRAKGGFFDAVLLRCTVIVAILVGLLGGGNMAAGKVEPIEEKDLMKFLLFV